MYLYLTVCVCQSVQLALHYVHAISLQFPPSETFDNIVVNCNSDSSIA